MNKRLRLWVPVNICGNRVSDRGLDEYMSVTVGETARLCYEMGSVGVFWVTLSDITPVWEHVCVCVLVVEGWVTQQGW